MKKLLLACAAMGAAALATPATAASLLYDFSSPSGVPGGVGTQTYTSGGITITANSCGLGLCYPDLVAPLFGKAGGGDENGLGIAAGATGDSANEITGIFGVELDVLNLIGHVVPGSVDFQMGSTTAPDTWEVLGSNVRSGSWTPLLPGADEGSHPLPDFGTYRYYEFVATSGDVLLANLTASTTAVPEPATWALMLIGIGGLGAALRSSRKSALVAA